MDRPPSRPRRLHPLAFLLFLVSIAVAPAALSGCGDDGCDEAAANDGKCDPVPRGCGCKDDEICVIKHDGTCRFFGSVCRKKTVACPAAACSSLECDQYFCDARPALDGGARPEGQSLLTCRGPACPSTADHPEAVHCYGP